MILNINHIWCLTETMEHVSKSPRVDGEATAGCTCWMDHVTLASPTLWRYTDRNMLCKFSV